MAKVGFWLKGARGKLGNAVLSKSPNGTIAREIVAPSNPQTSKQMYQRAIFATVATAAKALKGIINHSFYGIKSGEACVREFRKINLHLLRNKVAADQAAESSVVDGIAMLAPKGYKFVVPNMYQISSGTLPSSALVVEEDDESTSLCVHGNGYPVNNDITRRNLIQRLFGVGPGEQLTLCYITVDSEYPIYQYPDERYASSVGFKCGENHFHAERIVFKEDGGWDETIALRSMDRQAVLNAIFGLVSGAKSDAGFLDYIKSALSVEPVGTAGSYTACAISWNQVVIADHAKAGAVIRSKKKDGVWNYSTAFMTIVIPDEGGDYGLAPEFAVNSYTMGTAVGENTDPFLDEGGTGGDLSDFNEGGGSTPTPTISALQQAVDIINVGEDRETPLTTDDVIVTELEIRKGASTYPCYVIIPEDEVSSSGGPSFVVVTRNGNVQNASINSSDNFKTSGWNTLTDSQNYPFAWADRQTGWSFTSGLIQGSVVYDSSLVGVKSDASE